MPRQTRLPSTMSATTHFTESESLRVRRLVSALGHNRARLRIDVSEGVFAAALGCGRVLGKTRERVVARLGEIEMQAKGATS